jgi:hypothetical protein
MKAVEWCAADAFESSSTILRMTSSSSRKDDDAFVFGAQFLKEVNSSSFAENKLSRCV